MNVVKNNGGGMKGEESGQKIQKIVLVEVPQS